MNAFVTLYRSEWRKIIGNPLIMGCMVYAWPIVSTVIVGIFMLLIALNDDLLESYRETPLPWTETALLPWFVLNSIIGRLLLIGFAVTIFTSEYQNRTWKTVIPGHTRWQIIGMKYITMSTFVLIPVFFTCILVAILFGLMNLAFGAHYPPLLTPSTFFDFAWRFVLNAILAFVSALMVAGIGILIGIRTRSVIVGVIAAMFWAVLEFIGIPPMLEIASRLLDQDWVINLIVLMPSYQAENINAWVNLDEPARYYDEHPLTLNESILGLTAWLTALIGLTTLIFQYQDIE